MSIFCLVGEKNSLLAKGENGYLRISSKDEALNDHFLISPTMSFFLPLAKKYSFLAESSVNECHSIFHIFNVSMHMCNVGIMFLPVL